MGRNGKRRNNASWTPPPPRESKRSRAQTSQRAPTTTAAQAAAARRARLAAERSAKSSKPKLDPKVYANLRYKTQKELSKLKFSIQNAEELRKYLIELATIVEEHAHLNDGGINENNFSPRQMFEDDNFWNFIQYVWRITDLDARTDAFKKKLLNAGVDGVKQIFQYFFKVDITIYANDKELQEMYDNADCWPKFVRRITLYHCRVVQKNCARKGCPYKTSKHTKFGGAGYSESDHVLENYYNLVGTMLEKAFDMTVSSADHSWPVFLAELAKILCTCSPCHQHDASSNSCLSELPSQPSEEYCLYSSSPYCIEIKDAAPVAPFAVMDSPQGQQIERLTDKYCNMTTEDLEAVEYDDIKQDYDENGPISLPDIHYQTKEKWESSNAKQRKCSLLRAEITGTKTLVRFCFRCGKNALKMAAKHKQALHLHHMLEEMKDHDPSDGVNKSIEEQRFENRKTIMLCCGCHTLITHCKWENERLVAKFEELGYQINEETGEITCSKPYDGLYIGRAK